MGLPWRNIVSTRGDFLEGGLQGKASNSTTCFSVFAHSLKTSYFPTLVDVKLGHFNQGSIHQVSRNGCAVALMLCSYLSPEPQEEGSDRTSTRSALSVSGLGSGLPTRGRDAGKSHCAGELEKIILSRIWMELSEPFHDSIFLNSEIRHTHHF